MEENLDKNWFIQKFENLPNETEHIYEKEIVSLALCDSEKRIEQILKEILEDDKVGDNQAYAAYCTLHSCYRRMHNFSKLTSLVNQFSKRFSKHPSVLHFELLAYVDMGKRVDGEYVLKKAEDSIESLSTNAGAHHLLADLVAHYYEENSNDSSLLNLEDALKRNGWINRGMEAVNCAIFLDDYPKFYYTLARLLSLQNKYNEALEAIKQAVDKEDSSKSDYVIRMSTYLSQKMKIESQSREFEIHKSLQKYQTELTKNQDEAEKKINEKMENLNNNAVKNLEFLGLFAGIVSFTIAGVNIASNAAAFSFIGAAGLIIVLMGALLGVFCGFGIILNGWEKEKIPQNSLVLIFSLLMIILGLELCLTI